MENKKLKHLAKTLAKDMIRRDMKNGRPIALDLPISRCVLLKATASLTSRK